MDFYISSYLLFLLLESPLRLESSRLQAELSLDIESLNFLLFDYFTVSYNLSGETLAIEAITWPP